MPDPCAQSAGFWTMSTVDAWFSVMFPSALVVGAGLYAAYPRLSRLVFCRSESWPVRIDLDAQLESDTPSGHWLLHYTVEITPRRGTLRAHRDITMGDVTIALRGVERRHDGECRDVREQSEIHGPMFVNMYESFSGKLQRGDTWGRPGEWPLEASVFAEVGYTGDKRRTCRSPWIRVESR